MKEYKDFILYNPDTGEMIEDGYSIVSLEDKVKKQEKKRIREQYQGYGRFYWILYHIGHELLDGIINDATLTRYIYLCTYIGYDNKLQWKQKHYIYKTDISDILKLSSSAAYTFLSECRENNLLTINKDNTITITHNIYRGKLKKVKNYDTCRIYINTVRKLYESCSPREHKTLSYLFALLPYVNVEYNILCTNPLEKDIDHIQPLLLDKLCQLVGYDPNNARKLKNILLDIEVDGIPAVKLVVDKYKQLIYVNPHIYYAGNQHDKIMILGKFDAPNNPKSAASPER